MASVDSVGLENDHEMVTDKTKLCTAAVKPTVDIYLLLRYHDKYAGIAEYYLRKDRGLSAAYHDAIERGVQSENEHENDLDRRDLWIVSSLHVLFTGLRCVCSPV